MVAPKAWLYMSRASEKMEFWMVMFTVGSFSPFLVFGSRLYTWRYMDMFSSSPHDADTWSIMMLPTGLPPKESSRCHTMVSPRRKRMCRMTTSCVSTQNDCPETTTPSPGAVCPAMVM